MSFFTTGNKYEKQERLVSSRKDAAIRVVWTEHRRRAWTSGPKSCRTLIIFERVAQSDLLPFAFQW
jgi:hypothetical protein